MRSLMHALERRQLLSAGTLDPGFGVDGTNRFEFRDGQVFAATQYCLTSDGATLASGLAYTDPPELGDPAIYRGAVVRFLKDGALDTSFGTNGLLLDNAGGMRSVTAIEPASGGGFYLTGTRDADQRVVLARYDARGRRDKSFGAGRGFVFVNPVLDNANDILVQRDGKIVLAGHGKFRLDDGPAVMRLNADGRLDGTFGHTGVWLNSFGRRSGVVSMVTDNSGRLVLGINGTTNEIITGGLIRFAEVMRLTAEGAPDVAAGWDFPLSMPPVFTQLFQGEELADTTLRGIAVGADNSIYVLNAAIGGFITHLLHISTSRQFDQSFGPGENGALDISSIVHASGDQGATAEQHLVRQADGKLLIGGHSPSGAQPVVARLDALGQRDTTFGDNGVAILFNDPPIDDFHAVNPVPLLVSDGSIAAGVAHQKLSTADETLRVARIFRDDGPAGLFSARDISGAHASSHILTVTYRGEEPIDTTLLNSRDLRVTGPDGFVSYPRFSGFTSSQNGQVIVATYRLIAPGGAWDAADNGTYTVQLRGGAVADVSGHANLQRTIGSFVVRI